MSSLIHLVLNSFQNDSRVLKSGMSTVDNGIVDEVIFIAFHKENLDENEELTDGLHVRRIRLKSGVIPVRLFALFFKYIEWSLKACKEIYRHKPSVIHLNDIAPFCVALIAKLFLGIPYVYDAHELETERSDATGFKGMLIKVAERLIIRFASEVITVSDCIADWYEEHYRIERPYVVRNIPFNRDPILENGSLKEEFNVSENSILYIYTGGLSKGRGIERLLDIFSQLDCEKNIVFMGDGVLRKKVIDYSNEYSNIYWKPPVEPSQVVSYVAGADVAICFIENICLSYYYCLPNKFFEAMVAGVPVICNDLPELNKIVSKYETGWIVGEKGEGIFSLVQEMTKTNIDCKKANVLNTRNSFDWNNEAFTLIDVYKKVIGSAKKLSEDEDV